MTMHADEVVATADQVRRLLAEQFPDWAGLSIRPVPIGGSDHALFRLGEHLVARMPRIEDAAEQAENDRRWLPYLAPHLPLPVPVPLAVGEPGAGFPHPWSVATWLPGENPGSDNVDLDRAAIDLAAFVRALREVDPVDGPRKVGTTRGTPLIGLDAYVHRSLEILGDRVDQHLMRRIWKDALAATAYVGDGSWLHGDLLAGNLLCADRRLTAVIDFGALGVGDPAPDLTPAWTIFDGIARDAYRHAVGCDEDEWRRGRGWALAPALGGLGYYSETFPLYRDLAERTIAAVSAEFLAGT